jgi:hypothetical protein
MWQLSHRADSRAAAVADRHYSRQKPGSPQFVPPGRCMVLFLETTQGNAYWVTSWPFAQYVKHAWAGAWICSAFRNESHWLSSGLVRDAVAATRAFYGEAPPLGMVTFVDRSKVRRKRDFGRCFRKAGFRECGETRGGLLALQLLPDQMPDAQAPIGMQAPLLLTRG